MSSCTEVNERRIYLQSKVKRTKQKIYARKVPLDPTVITWERRRPSTIDQQEKEIPTYPKSKEDYDFLYNVVKRHFCFSTLSEDILKQLVNAFQQETIKANETIITQGDTQSEFYFYVMQQGLVKFLVDQKEICRHDEGGSTFGELELLNDATPRLATVVTVQDSTLWKVGQDVFRFVVTQCAQKQQENQLQTISPLFEHCNKELLKKLEDVFTTVKFYKEDRIITKGDIGSVFYVIKEGDVLLSDMGTGTTHVVDQIITKGSWFGGHELKTENDPRFHNATAKSDEVTLLALSKEHYLELLYPSLQPILDREVYKQFLKSLPIFANTNSNFTDEEIGLLVDKLDEQAYEAGDLAVDGSIEDEDRRCLWIIRRGYVTLFDGTTTHHLTRGDIFGDKWLNEATRRKNHTSISAATAKATCVEDTLFFILDGKDIELVIGDLQRLGASLPYQYKGLDDSIQLQNLQKHKILGKGEFAVVYLASDTTTQKTYALKTLSKLHLLEHETNAIEATLHEKEIMKSIIHPFIMSMYGCFQDLQYIYLVLPLFQGGELFSLIYQEDGSTDGLSTEQALFYSACVVEALGHLHSRHIIHRDLKPDNVMINGQGYGVVIDMGLAKFVVGKTYTMVGTPSYVAPEVLIMKGHNYMADYWSLGCLLYEMLGGTTPFYWEGATQYDEFEAIATGNYQCPNTFPDSAKDIIDKLLVVDPEQRLGSGIRGHTNLETSAWFDTMNFKQLRQLQVVAPWIPAIKDSLDASNFAELDESEIEPPYRELTEDEQDLFKAF